MTLLGHPSKLDAFQQRAIAIIKPLIPPDAKDRVSRTVEQFNKPVRDQIREETRLGAIDDNNSGSVVVRIEDGLPTGVAHLIDKYGDMVLWRLIMLQPRLGAVIDGLDRLLKHWEDFEAWLELPDIARGSAPALNHSTKVAYALQTLVVTRRVLDEVRKIDEDILGAYHFNRRPGRIAIYWMAHALFGAAFGVRIEDLTVVALAHELAHAYTHLGRDIGGDTWLDPGFRDSDSAVVEGLAQHYTAAVMQRLRVRAPAAIDAYHELLEHQSGAYRAHESWFSGHVRQRAEIVRFAMLRARNRGKVTDAEWRTMLIQAANDLRRS
jgi:hypothetical protein